MECLTQFFKRLSCGWPVPWRVHWRHAPWNRWNNIQQLRVGGIVKKHIGTLRVCASSVMLTPFGLVTRGAGSWTCA